MKKINTSKSLIFGREYKDIKNSLEYLNQDGYFSNRKDFSDYTEGKLDVVEVADFRFRPYAFINDGDRHVFSYFIPKSEVVFAGEPAKKYRPFKDFEEFANYVGLRDSAKVQFIEFRSKSGDLYDLAYNGYEKDKFGNIRIHLGSFTLTLQELFNRYEYKLNSFESVPFGVEE